MYIHSRLKPVFLLETSSLFNPVEYQYIPPHVETILYILFIREC